MGKRNFKVMAPNLNKKLLESFRYCINCFKVYMKTCFGGIFKLLTHCTFHCIFSFIMFWFDLMCFVLLVLLSSALVSYFMGFFFHCLHWLVYLCNIFVRRVNILCVNRYVKQVYYYFIINAGRLKPILRFYVHFANVTLVKSAAVL